MQPCPSPHQPRFPDPEPIREPPPQPLPHSQWLEAPPFPHTDPQPPAWLGEHWLSHVHRHCAGARNAARQASHLLSALLMVPGLERSRAHCCSATGLAEEVPQPPAPLCSPPAGQEPADSSRSHRGLTLSTPTTRQELGFPTQNSLPSVATGTCCDRALTQPLGQGRTRHGHAALPATSQLPPPAPKTPPSQRGTSSSTGQCQARGQVPVHPAGAQCLWRPEPGKAGRGRRR